MSDPVPEGYLSLREAFELFRESNNTRVPGPQVDIDADLNELVEAFASNKLAAFVRSPGKSQNCRLQPGSWREQFFSDRVFLADGIVTGKGDPWAGFVGRTPFVAETMFRTWLAWIGASKPKRISALPHLKIEPAELEKCRFLFLGQAIEWIISRGQVLSREQVFDRWDDAERQLLEALDTHDVAAEGYQTHARSRVYEALPKGIWARMNKGSLYDPFFSPIDESEGLENGGSVYAGDTKWCGVRIPTAFVLERWPPTPNKTEHAGDSADRPRKQKYDTSRVEEWFIRRVESWKNDPTNTPRFARDQLWELVSAQNGHFPGLSSTDFRRVWEKHAPPGWRVRGRFAAGE